MTTNIESPIIRPMKSRDFKQVSEIDRKVIGRDRIDYWKLRTEIIEKLSTVAALVAEINGRIVGFIIGDITGWTYGVPENIGWINAIVVDPEFQRKGIGQMLFNEMIDYLKKAGVKSIYAFVHWRDFNLLRFFDSIGFKKGDIINLKLDIV